MGFRDDGNSPRLAMVLVLVSIRLIAPDIPRRLNPQARSVRQLAFACLPEGNGKARF